MLHVNVHVLEKYNSLRFKDELEEVRELVPGCT